MKRFFALLSLRLALMVVALVSVVGAVGAAEQPLRIAVSSHNPPFSLFDKERSDWSGFEVDIINAICLILDRDCQLTASSSMDVSLSNLREGQIDVLISNVGPSITIDRMSFIFSRHLYSSGVRFLRKKSDKGRISYKSLHGKIIGVRANSAEMRFLQDKFLGVHIKPFPT